MPDKQNDSLPDTSTQAVRLHAVGNRIDVSEAQTEQTFVRELERIVALAAPNLARERPNLVALGELLGLPLALVGPSGFLSRKMHSSNMAISMLAPGYAARMVYYRRRYPKISLVRALLLSLTDVMYRPFVTTLSRLAAYYHIYLSATTLTPHVRLSTEQRDIQHFGSRCEASVYLPEDECVYNTGFLWGPDGTLLGTTDKVFITSSEKETLDITAGKLDQVAVFDTEIGRIGMAISLDAFTPDYMRRLDDLRACIVIQNDANDQPWAAPSKTWDWQPQEWLNAVLGSIQADYPHIHYNVCPMQVGNFFDVTFDGQSTITMKSESTPDPACNFVGCEGFVHTVTGAAMQGTILAMSPWIIADPGKTNSALSLAERRTLLSWVGKQHLPGKRHANRYPETAIWADVEVSRRTR